MINSTTWRPFSIPGAIIRYKFSELRYNNSWPKRWGPVNESRLLKCAIHAIVWMFLGLLPFLLVMAPANDWNAATPQVFTAGKMFSFIAIVLFFYINYYVLLPRWYLRRQYVKYFLSATMVFALVLFLQYYANDAGSFFPGPAYTAALFIISTLLSLVICQQSGMTKTEAEIEKIKTKLLNAQINPHFLFNSLNWIYFLAIEQSGDTPGAIVQLSGFMRYLLKDANADAVALSKEIEYIKNYLALQQGKLGNTVSVNCCITEYQGPLQVAPLLAMTFIENAFKHGVNPAEDSAIRIDLSLNGNRLLLQVINNKVTPTIKAAGSGLGIENAKQRLQLLYPCQHHLDILDNERIYSVKLSIKLQ
jgi:sensor histidine kinase YesM